MIFAFKGVVSNLGNGGAALVGNIKMKLFHQTKFKGKYPIEKMFCKIYVSIRVLGCWYVTGNKYFGYDRREIFVKSNALYLAVCFGIGHMQIMRHELNESMIVLYQ